MRITTRAVLGFVVLCLGFAGGVSADTLAEISPSNIIVNPSFEAGSGDSAAAWMSVLRVGHPQCFVAGPEKAHSGNRCIAVRGNSAGPATFSGWKLSGSTVEIRNPAGTGTAEGLTVDAGENYLRITDDPGLASDMTTASSWPKDLTIVANHTYKLRFKYGKSSDPTKTWTRIGAYLAGCPTAGSFDGSVPFANPNQITWSGDAGWKTYEYSETIQPGDPKIGMRIGLRLEGITENTTDAYYFDEVELTDTAPVQAAVPVSITYQGELTNAAGQMISDAPHSFVFKFYNQQAGGQPLWASSAMVLALLGGVFTARIDLPADTQTAIPDTGAWMEVVVDSETLSPRIKIDCAPSALVTDRVAE